MHIVVSMYWLYIWIACQVFYKELLSICGHLTLPSVFLVVVVSFIFLVFCVVLLCVFTFWVPCCDYPLLFPRGSNVRLSLPPVVCKMVSVLFGDSGIQRILCCVFVLFFLRLVYHVLPVSLDCLFLIVSSVLSGVYFHIRRWYQTRRIDVMYMCVMAIDFTSVPTISSHSIF